MRYDLLKHGRRIEDLGTSRLTWADAHCLLTQQPPKDSAVARALYPEDHARDLLVQRVETLAVLLMRGQMLAGNQSEVDVSKLPSAWADLWADDDAPVEQPREQMTMDEVDARMGWSMRPDGRPDLVLLTTDEVDDRMGW